MSTLRYEITHFRRRHIGKSARNRHPGLVIKYSQERRLHLRFDIDLSVHLTNIIQLDPVRDGQDRHGFDTIDYRAHGFCT